MSPRSTRATRRRILGNRKGISPVLAEVILIAITLVAAVALAGFVFGLFGSFTSTAQVTVSGVACYTKDDIPSSLPNGFSGTPSSNVCLLKLGNTGSSPTSVTRCAFGVGQPGTLLNSAGLTPTAADEIVHANSVQYVECQPPATGFTSAIGSYVSGSATLTTNGASVSFAGLWL